MKQSGVSYALGGSTLVLEQFSKIAGLVPAPLVKPVVELALSILDVVQTMRETKEICKTLITQLGKIMVVVLEPLVNKADDEIPTGLRDNLKRLESGLKGILSILEKIRDTPKWKALLRVRDRTAKLAECQQLMDQETTFFNVDALIDGAMKLDVMGRKVDVVVKEIKAIGQDVKDVREAVTVTAEIQYPSSVLPFKPDWETLFGRDTYVEDVVDRLCLNTTNEDGSNPASTPPRLAILGPGGIGKTSVALAAVSNPRVKRAYNDCIHWVPCVEATTPELLIELIARSMGVSKGKGADRKRDITDFLRSSSQPRLLLLDNFETPWDIPTRQSDINDIIFDIANESSLTILITMRSDVPPSTRIRWTRPTLPPLAALSLPAARGLYLDIHEQAGSDNELDSLLGELAGMPLAVRLMANRGRLGEMPSTLLALWKDERVRTMLLHQGDDRITSVMVSVELSINSNHMQRNPDALILLSLLAELPAGARRVFLQDLAPSIIDVGGALVTLRQAALVNVDPSTEHIQLLSPVRALILQKNRVAANLLIPMRRAYFELVRKYNSVPGDTIFLEAVQVIGIEAANIEALLMGALDTEPSDACIVAAYDYTEVQLEIIPAAEIIEKAVAIVRSRNRAPELLSRGLNLLSSVYRKLSRYAEAMKAGQEALMVVRRIGDQLGEAKSLDCLGNTQEMLDRYDDAVRVAQEALAVYRLVGSQVGEAGCLQSMGDAYRKLGRYDDALKVGLEALTVFRKIKDQLGEAKSLNSLGDTYQTLGRYEEALKAGQEALTVFRRIGHQLGEANSLQSIGNAYRMLDRYEEAVKAIQKALVVYKRIGSQLGEAGCLKSIGDAYRMLNRFEDAVNTGMEALVAYRRIGSRLGEAGCLQSIGDAYRMLDRYEEALEAGQQALELYKKIGCLGGEANSLCGIAEAYRLLDRYEDAAEAGQKALAVYGETGTSIGQANSLLNIGEAYRALDRYGDAVEASQRAMAFYRQAGSQLGEARCLHSAGDAYRMLDQYEKALEAGQKALSIHRRTGNQLGEASSLWSMGNAYRMLGRYDKALKAGKQALEAYKRFGSRGGEANSLNSVAEAYRMLGLYDEAVVTAKEALVIYEQIESPGGMADSLWIIGNAFRMLDRYEEAADSGEQALAVYTRIGHQLGTANSLDCIGDAYRMLGRYQAALEVGHRALEVHMQIGQKLGEANCLQSIGQSNRMLKQYDKAADATQRAVEVFRLVGQQLGEANSLWDLGYTYDSLGRCDDAVRVTREAMGIFLRIGRDGEADHCRTLLIKLGDHSP